MVPLEDMEAKGAEQVPNLKHRDPPRKDLPPPSVTSLKTYEDAFEVALNPDVDPEAF